MDTPTGLFLPTGFEKVTVMPRSKPQLTPADPLHPLEKTHGFRWIAMTSVVAGCVASILVIWQFYRPAIRRDPPNFNVNSTRQSIDGPAPTNDANSPTNAREVIGLDPSEIQLPLTTAPTTETSDPFNRTEIAMMRAMRQKAGVHLLDPLDNERHIVDVPPNTYGFVNSVDFVFEKIESVPLKRSRHTEDCELYKLAHDRVNLVAFVNADVARTLLGGRATMGMRFVVYSTPWSGAQSIVSIPCEHLNPDRSIRNIQIEGREFEAIDMMWK